MGITFGAARGQSVSGGSSKPGDQAQKSDTNDTSGEVAMHTSYNKTCYVFRYTNADYATKMAQSVITACNNRNIGYSQDRRTGIGKYGLNSTTATDADCSSLVSYCIKVTTGKNLGWFNTESEPSSLRKSGLFQEMGKYYSTSNTVKLYNGDILCTTVKGHTLTVVKGNPREGQADTELAGAISDSGSAYDSALGYSFDRTKINTEVLDQYVLIVDRTTPSPDYATWKKKRVAGVIIEAGYLYNSSHTLQSNPRNPYIDDMCKNAAKAGMPFGLFWYVRAKTETEAKQELYQLQFLIRKYPPTLGMWLHIDSSNSKTVNDTVIKVYDQEFEILGIKNSRGFWVTNDELTKLSWSKWYETWWLILNSHLTKSIEDLSSLLDPEFFEVSKENQVLEKTYRELITYDTTDTGAVASGTASASSGKFPYFPLPANSGWRKSSDFGNRSSPGGVGSTNHKGVDLAVAAGTEIYAVDSGKVTIAQSSSSAGNYVAVDHGNGIVTKYMHMKKYVVSKGNSVTGGQLLGYVDSTGHSTGNHLHFQVEVNGTAVDPKPYIGIT